MIKIKTVKSYSKRFKRNSNNFKCRHANFRHILTKKSTKRKRHLRSISRVSKRDLNLVERCLPYR